jgi:hypothetical protein
VLGGPKRNRLFAGGEPVAYAVHVRTRVRTRAGRYIFSTDEIFHATSPFSNRLRSNRGSNVNIMANGSRSQKY